MGFVVLCLASRVTFQTPDVHGLFIKEHLMFANVRGCRQEIQFIVNVCATVLIDSYPTEQSGAENLFSRGAISLEFLAFF